MKIDFSNERYSIILAGILILIVAFTVTVIILGLWGFEVHLSNNRIETLYMEKSYDDLPEKNGKFPSLVECTRELQLESEAKVAFDICHDVAPGWVKVDYDIPYELPICLTEDYVDQHFKMSVWSYGTYEPDELGINYLVLYQPTTDKGGIVDITWNSGVKKSCGLVKYTSSFDIIGEEPIEFESNHLPTVINEDSDYTFILESEPTPNLGKWVDIGVFSSWECCPDPIQKFKLILTQN